MHMKHMAEVFGNLEWWKLEPAHHLILNQEDMATKRMVLARTPEKKLAVAYLPDNNQITIRMSEFPHPMQVRWFDPKTGQNRFSGNNVPNTNSQTFIRPDEWEDALLILSVIQ